MQTSTPVSGKPVAWAWPHTDPCPADINATYPGTDYGRVIAAATDESGRQGLDNYWRGLWVQLSVAPDLEALRTVWEYCYRVSDRQSLNFKKLTDLKNRRKQEFLDQQTVKGQTQDEPTKAVA